MKSLTLSCSARCWARVSIGPVSTKLRDFNALRRVFLRWLKAVLTTRAKMFRVYIGRIGLPNTANDPALDFGGGSKAPSSKGEQIVDVVVGLGQHGGDAKDLAARGRRRCVRPPLFGTCPPFRDERPVVDHPEDNLESKCCRGKLPTKAKAGVAKGSTNSSAANPRGRGARSSWETYSEHGECSRGPTQ